MKQKKDILIVFSAAAVVIVLFLLAAWVIPARKYSAAKALYDAGQYEEAIAAFEALGPDRDCTAEIEACKAAIKEQDAGAAAALAESGDAEAAYAILNVLDDPDSVSKAKEYLFEIQKGRIGSVNAGDIIRFGSWEQDGNPANGPEEIEWIVLDISGSEALVISRYGLDAREFNDEKNPYSATTWRICQLRTWLNGAFYSSAFGPGHQGMILTSDVPAGTNPDSSVSPGSDTKDNMFLLSIEEASRYFDSDSARKCFGTPYCNTLGPEKGSDGACTWWLRSPGVEFSSVSVVTANGIVFTNGYSSGHIPNPAVRPVMRIDLSTGQ